MQGLTEIQPLRRGGFLPALSDAEVITMELIGEFQGYDTDKGIWCYFRDHWGEWFPDLPSRSQFAKQAANLWAVKQHFHRARNARSFKSEAAYGYCASKGETYFGFKGHVILDFHGALAGFTLTPSSVE